MFFLFSFLSYSSPEPQSEKTCLLIVWVLDKKCLGLHRPLERVAIRRNDSVPNLQKGKSLGLVLVLVLGLGLVQNLARLRLDHHRLHEKRERNQRN